MPGPAPVIGNISDTALWVAVYRAMETERPDALFRDPLARKLAGERGERIVRELRGGRQSAWAIVTRTCVLDELILQAVRERGVDTVVNLAAGLDTRPYRLELPAELHWIEVDLPPMIEYKNEVLAGEKARCALERVALDLSDVPARRELLARLGARARKALVITEGLLMYLEEEQVIALARDLRAQPSFSLWLQDYVSPRVLKMINRMWGKHLRAGNSLMRFGVEGGASYYAPFGWKVLEDRSSLEESHRFGREMQLGWLWWRLSRLAPEERLRKYRQMSGYALLERA